ncbi:MAG: sulfatase-like hydrolase/transferase [Pseudomonadota bacterium]
MASERNILLISFDDAVAFWKYKRIFGAALSTPNLDRICDQSTSFHAAYTQAPVCNPSRASFMSGLSPAQSGITMPKKEVFDCILPRDFIPAHLKDHGYFSSSGGKGVGGYLPLDPDWHAQLYSDERKKFRKDWKVPPDISRAYGGFRGGKAIINPERDRRLYDFQATNSAISFLDDYAGDQPFFREVGYYSPHGPWITPARFKEMYDTRGFEKPRAWADGFPEAPHFDAEFTRNFNADGPLENWQKSVRNYFSAVSHVDHHLGRLWDALKASPHADSTVVIITSDHGHHLGDHHRFRKHTLFEQACNVPLIIHDPALPVPQVVTDPVALVDIVPTILDYAGLAPMPGRVGRSLRDLMALGRAPDRAVPTFLRGNSAIRKGRYRFIHYEDGHTQLFDLAQDWWQTRDLGPDHPAYGDMADAHRETCLAYGHDPARVAPVAEAV